MTELKNQCPNLQFPPFSQQPNSRISHKSFDYTKDTNRMQYCVLERLYSEKKLFKKVVFKLGIPVLFHFPHFSQQTDSSIRLQIKKTVSIMV